MFDIDKEIHAWCCAIHTNGFNRNAKIEELKDHLYCEIARLTEEGLSEEQAFFSATERMGNVEALAKEHAKNRSFISERYYQTHDFVIHNLEKWRNVMGPKITALLIVVISLIFAGAMILSSYLLGDTQYEPYSQTVTNLLIALWFIPYTLLSIAGVSEKGSIRSEFLCIKRKVAGLFSRG